MRMSDPAGYPPPVHPDRGSIKDYKLRNNLVIIPIRASREGIPVEIADADIVSNTGTTRYPWERSRSESQMGADHAHCEAMRHPVPSVSTIPDFRDRCFLTSAYHILHSITRPFIVLVFNCKTT
jgi:hypothetical protein